MGKIVKILSIDGGGIRGVIPAMILDDIETRTGKPIAELFDLIAGTSTGGILALGLAKPDSTQTGPEYSAKDLVELYEKRGSEIFSRSIWHRTRALGNLTEEKYPAEGLETVLDETLGNVTLKETLTDVLVTSYDIERRQPYFFKSTKARETRERNFSLAKAARATSAAPTYFEPLKLDRPGTTDYYALVDGGVFANNPTMCALAEAIKTNPKAEGFLVASLGTGELTRRLPYEDVRGWGLAAWAQPILSVVFDGVNDTTNYQAEQLLPPVSGDRRYFRFQTVLKEGNDDMDDASRTNLRVLKLLGERLIAEENGALTDLCRQLAK